MSLTAPPGRYEMETELSLERPQVGKWRHFTRHFFEMFVVMMLGMVVLGAAFRAVHVVLFGSGYAAAWRNHVVLAAFAMAFNMTVPMVLWMRYRGHSWKLGGEMAAAMSLPLAPAFVLYGFDEIPAKGVLGMQMTLMVPAMLVAMLYRRSEYCAPHHGLRRPRRLAHPR